MPSQSLPITLELINPLGWSPYQITIESIRVSGELCDITIVDMEAYIQDSQTPITDDNLLERIISELYIGYEELLQNLFTEYLQSSADAAWESYSDR